MEYIIGNVFYSVFGGKAQTKKKNKNKSKKQQKKRNNKKIPR